MSYNKKFKERVLAYIQERHTQEAASGVFGISTSAIKEWNKRVASGEGLEARTRCRKRKKIEPEKLRAYISANPDAYIREIAAEIGCARSAVQKALKKLKITRKKRP